MFRLQKREAFMCMALFNMEMKMVNDFMFKFIVIWELGEISA